MATKRRADDLTDEQWPVLAPLIPDPPRRADGRGRPWRDTREVRNGVVWILRRGARWQDVPDRFPPYQPGPRRFQQWVRSGVLQHVREARAADLKARGERDLAECCIDGTFVVAKKGSQVWARPSGAKVRTSWPWQTALVFVSPSTHRLLRRMQSPLVHQRAPVGLLQPTLIG